MSDLLIRDGLVWAAARGSPPVGADILIAGGRITAISQGLAVPASAEVIDARGKLVMPGFVQGHVHLAQALFRGLANDRELLDWLFQRVLPLEAAHDAESLYDSARLGLAEMIRAGTTTVLDVGAVNEVDSIFQAIAESGMRAQSGQLLMDSPTTYPGLRQPTDQALMRAEHAFERWHLHDAGRIRCAFIPRGLLSVTRELVGEIGRRARVRGVSFHTHAHENRNEIAAIVRLHGDRPIICLEGLGVLGPNVQLAHCIWLEERELELLRTHDVKVIHCPSANAKLASGIAPVAEMQQRGITVALGADGAPCNDNLDPFMEMRLAGLLQKLCGGPTALPAADIVEMASLDGARAAGLAEEIGSVEVGKRGDLIIVNLDGIHANPWEPEALADLLVYAARASDVETTIVGGRILMRDRVLLTMSEEEVLRNARRSRERVLRRLGW